MKKQISENKKNLYGALVGILGSSLVQVILIMLMTLVLSLIFPLVYKGLASELITEKINDFINNGAGYNIIIFLTPLIVLIILLVIMGKEKIKKTLKDIFTKKSFIYGFIGFLVFLIVSVTYNTVIIKYLGFESSDNQGNVISIIEKLPIISFFLIVVIAPISEEITFRYFIFKGISKKNKVWAYIVSVLLFMLVHSTASFSAEYAAHGTITSEIFKQLITLPPYAFAGLIFAYIYDKSDSLSTSITAHFLNNLLSYILIVSSVALI